MKQRACKSKLKLTVSSALLMGLGFACHLHLQIVQPVANQTDDSQQFLNVLPNLWRFGGKRVRKRQKRNHKKIHSWRFGGGTPCYFPIENYSLWIRICKPLSSAVLSHPSVHLPPSPPCCSFPWVHGSSAAFVSNTLQHLCAAKSTQCHPSDFKASWSSGQPANLCHWTFREKLSTKAVPTKFERIAPISMISKRN